MSQTVKSQCEQAIALHSAGRLADARAAYAAVLRLDDANSEAINGLGAIACQVGDYEEAIRILGPLTEKYPRLAAAQNNLGEALRLSGRLADAEVGYALAIKAEGNRAEYYNNYGELLRALGRFDEAANMYECAIALKSEYTAAYANLAMCRKGADAATIARYEELLKRPLTKTGRSQIHFALGGFYDAARDFTAAFKNFEAANELKGVQFNGRAYAVHVQAIIDEFDESFFASRSDFGLSGEELPVFIVGMPRSGTSLVEQILASHPRVHGAGELTILAKASQQIAQRWGFPRGYEKMTRADVSTLAESVLAQLRVLGGGAVRVTDKMPMNFFHVGLIRLLFPAARVISCTRHPLDVALSCYMTDFSTGLPFSYNLRNIGIYYLGCRRLMRHFSELPGGRILNVPYEDLATNLEEGSRRLVEFCRLEWDDRCLRFFESKRPVSTASSWQVRQPVYTSSIERWRNYAEPLESLKKLLENETGESLD